ncbi:zinc finger BED domain-containing protein 4-like [Wyeomyia smithii]|uniref:zinc finger BED domain-containing protein 4-like n=1 Tax=Wyeomyia smithii TaxID=174621 RepID=UPI002467E8F7|nr:zinc finger BED domain-containing protein 4-like [Wyeomyia smithii]
MTEKRSAVWEFYLVNDEGKSAKCIECNATISRGGIGKNATNTAMVNHLKLHPKLYQAYGAKECERKSSKASKERLSQTTLKECFFFFNELKECLSAAEKWDPKSIKSKEITGAIAEMMVLDLQPFSMVENEGFRRLMAKMQPKYQIPSRKYFSTTIIPDMYAKCREAKQKSLPRNGFISCTTDIWSSPSNKAVISLTGHWLDENCAKQHAILNTCEFPGSHTGERIGNKIHGILADWNIPVSSVHLILRDNAANMIKGLDTAELPHAGCFIHTLQLVVLDALDSQKAVRDLIAKSRNIVTHFNHSPLACDKLLEIQKRYELTEHKLVQDIRTRWNSTFYMLQRLNDQRPAVTYYTGEFNSIKNLSECEWNLISPVLELLGPFEEITCLIRSENSCISEVIPYVITLRSYLEKPNKNQKSVEATKDALLRNMKSRFRLILQESVFTYATVVDPRFKFNFIPEEERAPLKDKIIAEITECSQDAVRTSDDSPLPGPSSANRLGSFPAVFKLIRKYLSAPASTIFSERLFSTEGLVSEQHRSSLLPEKAEMITCLNRNFKFLNE